jgi:plastocyanin
MRNRFVLLALLLPVFAACSDKSAADSPTTPAVVQTTVQAAAPNAAGTGAVGIANFKFSAPSINVAVGGSVVWTNNDTQQHTATSSGNFDAGAIQPGSSSTVQFPTAGSFKYICSFHPFMTGTVVVG